MEIWLEGGEKVKVKVRGFIIETDQPHHCGGEDTAPTPYELFLSGIGSCMGYYVSKVCKKYNLPVEGVKLQLEEEGEGIRVKIFTPKNFQQEHLAKMIEYAKKCKVKKRIEDGVNFEIKGEKHSPF